MEKEFVPYELAVKLKEIGFDEECFGAYHNENYLDLESEEYDYSYAVKAPLFQQAFRWFREKHNMPCKIEASQEDFKVNVYHYFYQIQTSSHIVGFGIQHNLTYEEAELACLTKLIEIVETRTK